MSLFGAGTVAAGRGPVKCFGLVAKIVGTGGDEVLRGTSGRDVIHGKGGRDQIFGGGGNDVICGGKGQDVVDGEDGNDEIFGQGGADALQGGPGEDRLYGLGGDDLMDGREGDLDEAVYSLSKNPITANLAQRGPRRDRGTTRCSASRFWSARRLDDNLTAGLVPTIVVGGAGNDTLTGGPAEDTFEGGAGNDSISGSTGTDGVTHFEAPGAVSVDHQAGTATGASTDTMR